jgi:hypothetical protein
VCVGKITAFTDTAFFKLCMPSLSERTHDKISR